MATLPVKKLPEGDEWLYELKWDGYRAMLIKDDEDVQIRSRNDKDLSAMYPGIAAAGRRQKIKQIVLDGETVCRAWKDGRPPSRSATISPSRTICLIFWRRPAAAMPGYIALKSLSFRERI